MLTIRYDNVMIDANYHYTDTEVLAFEIKRIQGREIKYNSLQNQGHLQ